MRGLVFEEVLVEQDYYYALTHNTWGVVCLFRSLTLNKNSHFWDGRGIAPSRTLSLAEC